MINGWDRVHSNEVATSNRHSLFQKLKRSLTELLEWSKMRSVMFIKMTSACWARRPLKKSKASLAKLKNTSRGSTNGFRRKKPSAWAGEEARACWSPRRPRIGRRRTNLLKLILEEEGLRTGTIMVMKWHRARIKVHYRFSLIMSLLRMRCWGNWGRRALSTAKRSCVRMNIIEARSKSSFMRERCSEGNSSWNNRVQEHWRLPQIHKFKSRIDTARKVSAPCNQVPKWALQPLLPSTETTCPQQIQQQYIH